MSEYKLGIEDIRDDYVWGVTDRTMTGPKEALDQFYTWLEQHDKEVRAKRDQELVEAINELPRTQIGDYILGLLDVDEEALIKGEGQKRTENGTELTEGENK